MSLDRKIAHGIPDHEYTEQFVRFGPTSFSWRHLEKPSFDKHLAGLYLPETVALDAGCGYGRTTEHLIESGILPANVTGVDINESLLGLARRNLPQATFIHADLACFEPVPDTYDLVTASMVFEYLDEDGFKRTLANVHKGLKDGGVLFFVTTHPLRMVTQDIKGYKDRGWRDSMTPWGATIPLFHRTVGDFISQTIQAGFTIETVNEPMLPDEAKEADPQSFERYSSYGVTRLVVVARK